MPTYSFKMQDGSVKEYFYRIADVPDLGVEVELPDGQRGERLFEPPQVQKPRVYTFVSEQVRLYHPDAPHYDSIGRACFESKREVQEFMSRTGMGYD